MKFSRLNSILIPLLGIMILVSCSDDDDPAPEEGDITVEFNDGGTKATAIRNLVVGGTTYDVEFPTAEPSVFYGAYPGTFTFTTDTDARVARDAINAALTNAGATAIGLSGETERSLYRIGYNSSETSGGIQSCNFVSGEFGTPWEAGISDKTLYNTDPVTWAIFTES